MQICIGAYLCIALFAIQLDRQWEFWVLAVFVGMFQEQSRRFPPFLFCKNHSGRENPANTLGFTTSAARAHLLWGRLWWV